MSLNIGDRIRVVNQEEKFNNPAGGEPRTLSNHNGREGEVIEVGDRAQSFKINRLDEGHNSLIITVRIDGENKLRGFPEIQLEKI